MSDKIYNPSIAIQSGYNFKWNWIKKFLVWSKLLKITDDKFHVVWAQTSSEYPNSNNIMYASKEELEDDFKNEKVVYSQSGKGE